VLLVDRDQVHTALPRGPFRPPALLPRSSGSRPEPPRSRERQGVFQPRASDRPEVLFLDPDQSRGNVDHPDLLPAPVLQPEFKRACQEANARLVECLLGAEPVDRLAEVLSQPTDGHEPFTLGPQPHNELAVLAPLLYPLGLSHDQISPQNGFTRMCSVQRTQNAHCGLILPPDLNFGRVFHVKHESFLDLA